MTDQENKIMTSSKIFVDPFHIRPEEIRIEDIAHSLSQMARANGHFKYFYSVAQHCVNCMLEAKNRGLGKRVQLACLLHDAAEAYISDIPRPVKHRLNGIETVEQKISGIIYSMFWIADLTGEEKAAVKEIDDAMLYHEFKKIMDVEISAPVPPISMEHDFSEHSMDSVYNQFIFLFKSLVLSEQFENIDRPLEKNVEIFGTDDYSGDSRIGRQNMPQTDGKTVNG